MGRGIVVNGRISCFASLPSLPQRAGPRCASSRIKPSHRSLIHAPSVLASFAESRTLHRLRCRQATIIALPYGAHHHKLHIGKFDAHDPTLPLIQKARRSRPPHQDEPRIDQSRWGGWVTRARRRASNTNASFRMESQSFLTRAVPGVRAGARLENRPSQDSAVRQTLGERIAAVRRLDYGPNAFVQRREASVQSSLRESSSRNSVGVRKSQTVHPSAHRPPGRLRRSLSAFRPLRRPRWTG
jgi:hypothetical protein